jgi:hypothetical protein
MIGFNIDAHGRREVPFIPTSYLSAHSRAGNFSAIELQFPIDEG